MTLRALGSQPGGSLLVRPDGAPWTEAVNEQRAA
jgi:hypothetical protein